MSGWLGVHPVGDSKRLTIGGRRPTFLFRTLPWQGSDGSKQSYCPQHYLHYSLLIFSSSLAVLLGPPLGIFRLSSGLTFILSPSGGRSLPSPAVGQDCMVVQAAADGLFG